MNTNNIISTPNITGNIGSCTNQVVSVKSSRTLFVQDITNVVTNSCTGEVKEYYTWEYTGVAVGMPILVAGGLFFGILAIGFSVAIVMDFKEWIEKK